MARDWAGVTTPVVCGCPIFPVLDRAETPELTFSDSPGIGDGARGVAGDGTNAHGQLGHGDTLDRPTPTIVELLESVGSVVQIAAGPSYALAVTDDERSSAMAFVRSYCTSSSNNKSEIKKNNLWQRSEGMCRGPAGGQDEAAARR